ncbi:PfkB family carbohydrate kinase [Microbacterium yannicii]|uniref:PfkB family carbohydrate kinase n=1 Tax=Microbacterium yannicii TaxID=671622 RepID=UPI0002EB55A6|nr:PfkB family carbohydrate kinase [Microbacterium yannicii]
MSEREDRFVVFGQIGQDLAMRLDRTPVIGSSFRVTDSRWLLGGKGANQAVGLRQLGAQVALVGAVGADSIGGMLRDAAIDDGIDVCGVARRGASAVLVDVVDRSGERLLLEHVPPSSLVTQHDADAAEDHVRRAGTVCLQAQQPARVLLHAAEAARAHGARVALDGAPEPELAERLVALADTLRADATEAEALVGFPIADEHRARAACADLLNRGPSVVALEVPGQGDLIGSRSGMRFLPHGGDVVDRTGAGDAFFVGLVRALARSWSAQRAGDFAAAAAASTVTRLGGRPSLSHLQPLLTSRAP